MWSRVTYRGKRNGPTPRAANVRQRERKCFAVCRPPVITTGCGVVAGVAFFTVSTIDRSDIVAVFWPGRDYLPPAVPCWLALGICGALVQNMVVLLSQPEPPMAIG